ncbi:hypothetical protein WS71_05495 [Burkholderia mayonis]|uniref:Uncharacterized protein n=1 Tax=Burkholderia mayonis TaxID=1385591 RepID=A0A1B4FT22_9BURK|nr:hypothetical protein WS71_05495 [Burkholderia mayonis]KVE57650.1 hypothetical protein WS71_26325 [Burkholderia mayonis]
MPHFDDRDAVRIRFGERTEAAMTRTRAGDESLHAMPRPFDDGIAFDTLAGDVARRAMHATAALDGRTPRSDAT